MENIRVQFLGNFLFHNQYYGISEIREETTGCPYMTFPVPCMHLEAFLIL